MLRGDGWVASWRGFVPRTGRVELSGGFYGDFGYDTDGRFRGRVTRAQMISERYRFLADEGWVVSPGYRVTRDVDEVRRFFGDESLLPDDGPIDREHSVMIDLDLDDVPPLPTRPSIVPADVAAAAGTTWIVDADLPLVASTASGSVVAEHILPSRIGGGRSVWATPKGCWVGGADGMFWLTSGRDPRRVDALPAHVGSVNGELLLVCTGDPNWRLYAPESEPLDVTALAGYVNSIAVQGNGWIAVVQPRGESVVRLVRVSSTGESTVGPAIPQLPRGHGKPYLAGEPLRLIRGVDMAFVTTDLGIRHDAERLGRDQFHGGQLGNLAWTIGHPPDGSSSSGWWPLPGPVTYERAEQFWLLTVYDGETFEPLTSVPVVATRPGVAMNELGRILVIARGVRSFRSDDPVMTRPVELDVAGALDKARQS